MSVVTFDERARLVARLMADDQGDGDQYLGQLDTAVEYLGAAGVPALIAQVEQLQQENARLAAAQKRAYARMRQVIAGVKDVISDRDRALTRATIQVLAMERAHAALDRDPSLPPPHELAEDILADALDFERHSR